MAVQKSMTGDDNHSMILGVKMVYRRKKEKENILETKRDIRCIRCPFRDGLISLAILL